MKIKREEGRKRESKIAKEKARERPQGYAYLHSQHPRTRFQWAFPDRLGDHRYHLRKKNKNNYSSNMTHVWHYLPWQASVLRAAAQNMLETYSQILIKNIRMTSRFNLRLGDAAMETEISLAFPLINRHYCGVLQHWREHCFAGTHVTPAGHYDGRIIYDSLTSFW